MPPSSLTRGLGGGERCASVRPPVGLDPQPDTFSCGPHALKHALTMLGVIAAPDRLARLSRLHWTKGTDEADLARAARAYGCTMKLRRFVDVDAARRAMVAALRDGPVLVCVDSWEHWITIVDHSRGRFVALDSEADPVVIVLEWAQLRERWTYEHAPTKAKDGSVQLFDMFPVRPRTQKHGPMVRARFAVSRAHNLRRPENRDLASCWDEYLEDLLEICRPRSPNHVDAITLGELVRRHRDILVTRVTYWHGETVPSALRRVLRNFRFVADTYGMVVPAGSQRRALADLAMLLMLWSVSRAPLDHPLYAPVLKRKKRHGAKKKA